MQLRNGFEAPLVKLSLSSTHTVHWAAQSLASGCDAELRRKRVPADTVGHRRQQPVELNDVLRARGRGSGGRTFREHRNKVHHSPGSRRARGTHLHDLACSNDLRHAEEPVTQVRRALMDLHGSKSLLAFARDEYYIGPIYEVTGPKVRPT